MIKNYLPIVFALLCFEFVFAQTTLLCSPQNNNIKIENTSDIPTISSNPDGTVTLTHPDQNITDIFSQYIIYDFYQSYPSSTGELFKYYTISHGNKDLINSIFNNVSPDVFLIQEEYTFTPIDQSLITLLDNKIYKLIKYCSDVPEVGETCETTEVVVSNDFELKIAFNYDSNSDVIHAETVNETPCGNSFSIGLKGGYDDFSGSLDNKLQLWESDLGISSESEFSEPCHYVEEMLYGLLDIGCLEGRNYGNLNVYPGVSSGQIIFGRGNATFSTDFITFEEDGLSIDDIIFDQIKPFKTSNNPYLQISNSESQSLTVEIISGTGQTILQNTSFEMNTINLSNFSKGIYFIKLKSLNNQQKVFKFLNN